MTSAACRWSRTAHLCRQIPHSLPQSGDGLSIGRPQDRLCQSDWRNPTINPEVSPAGETERETPMSDTAGAELPTAVLGLGLDIGGSWQGQRDRALVQSYLLNGSVQPTAAGGAGGARSGRGSLKLPSLAASARGRGGRGSVVCHRYRSSLVTFLQCVMEQLTFITVIITFIR